MWIFYHVKSCSIQVQIYVLQVLTTYFTSACILHHMKDWCSLKQEGPGDEQLASILIAVKIAAILHCVWFEHTRLHCLPQSLPRIHVGYLSRVQRCVWWTAWLEWPPCHLQRRDEARVKLWLYRSSNSPCNHALAETGHWATIWQCITATEQPAFDK